MRSFLITAQAGVLTVIAVLGAYGDGDAQEATCPLPQAATTAACLAK